MLCTLCWRITPLCSEPVQQWGYVLMHVQSDAHIHAHTLCSSSLHCSDLAFYWVLITLHHLSCVMILWRQRLTAWLYSVLYFLQTFSLFLILLHFPCTGEDLTEWKVFQELLTFLCVYKEQFLSFFQGSF